MRAYSSWSLHCITLCIIESVVLLDSSNDPRISRCTWVGDLHQIYCMKVALDQGPTAGQNLVFWQPADIDHDPAESMTAPDTNEGPSASTTRTIWKGQSMYVELFEGKYWWCTVYSGWTQSKSSLSADMVRTVIEHETHLILPHEAICLEKYAGMSCK